VARRIIIGLILTVVLLGVARRISLRKPIDALIEDYDLRIRHQTLTEQIGPGEPLLTVSVEPAGDLEVFVEYGRPTMKHLHEIRMENAGGTAFEARLPDFGKGARCKYSITVKRLSGVSIRLPKNPEKFFLIKFKGDASKVVLASHVAFMFGSFFFMILSFFGAMRILKGLGDKQGTVKAARWVLILSFIGGWPLGFILNHQTFGVIWEGYPFGYDITDNKTQVMFIVWLVSLLLVGGSFTGRGEEKDRLGARAFAWAIITSFILSLALFITPHGI